MFDQGWSWAWAIVAISVAVLESLPAIALLAYWREGTVRSSLNTAGAEAMPPRPPEP